MAGNLLLTSPLEACSFIRPKELAAMHPELEAAIQLFLANRGILLAPFHNMMLVSPVTGDDQIDRLVGAFADCVKRLKE